MSKFNNWKEAAIKAVKNIGVLDLGECPKCGQPVWLLEDDEEKPKP